MQSIEEKKEEILFNIDEEESGEKIPEDDQTELEGKQKNLL